MSLMDKIKTVTVKLKGIVQGVGFRPFIHRLALQNNLKGWALNSSAGVEIQVEGTQNSIDMFYRDISQLPPPAHITEKIIEPIRRKNFTSFTIRKSISDQNNFTIIPPDISICQKCKNDLFDPNNKRYNYPFITCTECGPRFTIIFGYPYDRIVTAMNKFIICDECYIEYNNTVNRRYHSQTNSCPSCGPKLSFVNTDGNIIEGSSVLNTIKFLSEGKIVAIKALGGFQLVCNAENDRAVNNLRKRKNRLDKPFAIMVKDLTTASGYTYISSEENKLLSSFCAPILLLRIKNNATISSQVAPHQKYLGIMLPYTPLHLLLFNLSPFSSLVMTSGNISNEPIEKENIKAIKNLKGIADYFLLNNCEIYNRCDDSVMFLFGKRSMFIRRSRGYAPAPIIKKIQLKKVLALGSELKNTFCFCKGNYLFISGHIGDLKGVDTFEYFKMTVTKVEESSKIKPEIVAYDLHPQILTTDFADRYSKNNNCLKIGVQHHHAHIASCMVDNNVSRNNNVIGIALDGTGFGTDGNLWGCEFFIADYRKYTRYASLKYLPMAGGEAAIHEPFRMAISILYNLYGNDLFKSKLEILNRISKGKIKLITQMVDKKINSPLTSSCGRLFDAVASLIGVIDKVSYEAQAAIELEMIADENVSDAYKYKSIKEDNIILIDPASIILGIIDDLNHNKSKGYISGKFHNTIINFSVDICQSIKKKYGVRTVVLSGGVFQNRILLRKMYEQLKKNNFNPLIHKDIPCNDGGISVGQAAIASHLEL